MNENFLQFAWKYSLFNKENLSYNDENIEIIDLGVLNSNAGPDFFNAKIKIGETVWVGNIEIDIKTSNWYTHKHNINESFNNVILQVVYNQDKENIYNQKGRLVPSIKININNELLEKYENLKNSTTWIACEKDFNKIDNFKLRMWLSNVLIERLQTKANYIFQKLNENKNNWSETFYQVLASSFGFKVNKEPFEWMANATPQKIIAKQKNNFLQIEAILFGQSGFLNEDIDNDYFKELKNEYLFLQKKYKLKPINKYLWKFLRLRPSNFPYIRISQFADLIFKSSSLFASIINTENIEQIKKMFVIKASSFWDNHYTFEKSSVIKEKKIGKQSVDIILINTIIPFLYVYGKATDNQKIKDRAINFLEQIKPENNKIIRNWKKLGIYGENAFYSQALIHLKNEYCNKKRCINCAIGAEILKNK